MSDTDAAVLVITSGKHGTFRVLVDREDYERAAARKWRVVNHGRRVYFQSHDRQHDGTYKTVRLHRFLLNTPDGVDVDHVHNNYLDLRKSELQKTTDVQNAQKQRRHQDGSSRYKGVRWYKRSEKWHAYIHVNGKQMSLGYHAEEESAARAYDDAARKHFGKFSCLNFPSEGECNAHTQ